MPAAPLVDFATLDLACTYATHAAIYSVLPHRGRFALLDGVACFDVERGISVGWKDIRADDWWACDHIPGRPLFPGVLMIESGAQLASWDFHQRNSATKGFVGFAGVDGVRFRGTVEPGVRMHWVTHLEKARARMFVYAVQGLVGSDLVFEAQVIGAVV